MSKIPTTLFGRGTKLFGMASKIAIQEVSSKLKTWEEETDKIKAKVQLAQDVVKTLSQLKGASMKLGQLISLDLGEYLPPEVLKVLEQLHHQSTFLDYPVIEKILKEELGDKFHHLKDITEKPIAAASIGQVHRARLDGKDVVIKVQYPGVAESIPSDLKLLEVIINQLNFLQRKKDTDLRPFFDEIREVLNKEADYVNEVEMHKLYRERFKDSPFIVPLPYEDYSTGKVLTQEFIFGVSFGQWLDTNPDVETKQNFADLLMKLYLEEVFHHGLVQTDPNPGNFLVTKDNQIALLDFGAVKAYGREFVEGYRRILIASVKKDEKAILEESMNLNFLDRRENEEVQKIYLQMMEFLVEPFRQSELFDFADKSFYEQSRNLSWELTKKCRYSPPPKDLLFLHRKLGGVFVFIRKLDVKIRLKDYWHYVEKA